MAEQTGESSENQGAAERVIRCKEMADEAQSSVTDWLRGLVEVGPFYYDEWTIPPGYPGLPESATKRYEAVAPKCGEENCEITVKIESTHPDSYSCRVSAACSRADSCSGEDADKAQKECGEHIDTIEEHFAAFAGEQVSKLEEAKTALAGRNLDVYERRTILGQVLKG